MNTFRKIKMLEPWEDVFGDRVEVNSRELAEYLGVSCSTVSFWGVNSRSDLPSEKKGKQRIFRKEDIGKVFPIEGFKKKRKRKKKESK